MTLAEVTPWIGRYAYVQYGVSDSGFGGVFEGQIQRVDDETILVVPRSPLGDDGIDLTGRKVTIATIRDIAPIS